MKTVFERHTYAPELNKIHAKRGGKWHVLPAHKNNNRSGTVSNVAEYRDSCRLSPGNYARITVKYSNPEFSGLNRVYSGKIESIANLLTFYKKIKAYHTAGPCKIAVEYLNII